MNQNNELIINNEKHLKKAVETMELFDKQITTMKAEYNKIKKAILEAMQEENAKALETDYVKFNRIMPYKKSLLKTDATNFLIEKDLLDTFQVLDEKAVMKAFPKYVQESEGKEYLKITFKGGE